MPTEELPPEAYVYRRIPAAEKRWLLPNGRVDPVAFLPNRADKDGLSLCTHATAREAAATGKRGKRFYVVRLRVADMVEANIRVCNDDDQHALIREWTYDKRDDDDVRNGAAHLAKVCENYEGPFDGEYDPPAKV